MGDYYDGTKLLSLKDINGVTPEIFLCTSNRSAGKTTYFNRLMVRRYLRNGDKFMLIYRFNYELNDVADKFFKDIKLLFFPDNEMTTVRKARGLYHELYLDGVSCGYAISLNAADTVKKYSHLFSDTKNMLFDEFQSETNHYCADEVAKLISVHNSVARGQGEMVRYVPLYMISNPVSLLNPYYVELGITDRLKEDTHFLRGDGYVLEQGFNTAASEAQKSSAFNRAFSTNKYVAYSSEAVYLNDNKAFIEPPEGYARYMMTLRFEGNDYGVKEYASQGIIYCDDRPDLSFPTKVVVTTEDHNINYVMLKRNDLFLSSLRYFFERGCFRFKNVRCKEVILRALSY